MIMKKKNNLKKEGEVTILKIYFHKSNKMNKIFKNSKIKKIKKEKMIQTNWIIYFPII